MHIHVRCPRFFPVPIQCVVQVHSYCQSQSKSGTEAETGYALILYTWKISILYINTKKSHQKVQKSPLIFLGWSLETCLKTSYLPLSLNISWRCSGLYHSCWANRKSLKALRWINHALVTCQYKIRTECDFCVNCTWSIDAICMLITVCPFAFPVCALCFVQMQAGKVTHILLSDTLHTALLRHEVCNRFFFRTAYKHKHIDNLRHKDWQRNRLPSSWTAWQMAQQQHSSAAPGAKQQMLDYPLLSRALIFEEILDLTWFPLSSCHS